MYEDGEEIIMVTVAFSQISSEKNFFVTVKNNYIWEKVITRAWEKLSEELQIPIEELQKDFSFNGRIQL